MSKNRAENLYKLTSKYDYVINCIGIIKPQINITSAESIKNAIYINSVFPKMLSDTLLKKLKFFRLLQIVSFQEVKEIMMKSLFMMIQTFMEFRKV